ncbi:MAG: hypothetical protein ACR2PK_14215 [Acidimicrobiales bacterium]
MQRTIVQIARVRLADIRTGDVINGHPDEEYGWFEVRAVRQLPSGDLVAVGDTSQQSVKGSPVDLAGVQVTKQVDVPPGQSAQPDVHAEASSN